MGFDDVDRNDEKYIRGMNRLFAFVAGTPSDEAIKTYNHVKSRAFNEALDRKGGWDSDYAKDIVVPAMRFLMSYGARLEALCSVNVDDPIMMEKTIDAVFENDLDYEAALYVVNDQATGDDIRKAAGILGIDAEGFKQQWCTLTQEDINPPEPEGP